MERCRYCKMGHRENEPTKHKPGCPEIEPSKKALYDQGWKDGRTRQEFKSTDLTYLIGWSNGDSAADAAENDERPW